MNTAKSSVAEIRARFDQDVERFSNLSTGQTATVDAAECMDLVTAAAAAATPQAGAVLDVGCGAGNFSLKLRERLPGVRFTLNDLSQPMLDRARERLGDSVVETISTDIREVDLGVGQFDIILAAAVLHHLRTPAEWLAVFEKFFSALKPGGGLWIFDLVAHEDAAIQYAMWERYGRYLVGVGGEAYRDKVFAYVEKEDSPVPLTFQLELMRKVGFRRIDVLHKKACFAACGGGTG